MAWSTVEHLGHILSSQRLCKQSGGVSRGRATVRIARRTLIAQPPRHLVTPQPLRSLVNPTSEDARAKQAYMRAVLDDLNALRIKAKEGGGKEVLERWKARGKGKMGVRERVEALIDPASPFLELSALAAHEVYPDPLPGAGLVTGIGLVAGKKCMIAANDPTVKGGAYYPLTVKKHLRAQQIALENRLPCIYLVESGGAALPFQSEVFPDHDHFGRIFYNMARMSGLGISQISVVHGISVAGGAYMPAMSDVVIIVKNQGRIFLAGPPLVKAATGEIVDEETLGGGEMHTSVSGVADHLATNDAHAIRLARQAVQDLGAASTSNEISAGITTVHAPLYPPAELDSIVPADPRQTYDMREVIARIVDGSEFREFKQEYGKTIITGFAEIHGHKVGIVANAGVLLSPSALKATHFIQLCSQRQIPLLFLVNVSGYMVGESAERGGIAKDGAKMVRAVARAKVPKFTVVVGGMCGRAYSPRFLFMWPNAKICVMGPDQLSSVMQTVSGKRRLPSSLKQGEEDRWVELRGKIQAQSSALYSTARIWDDGIIAPSDTRDVLGLGLELAAEEKASRDTSVTGGQRGEIGADGDVGDWGVFRM
ncbi:carboxyl transferase domain-domain-containing protein [Naematelia encephala]|uniref:methylcrotonoyl-CoA carboxylase n=1 Tax=Naematelia encephala TaxID=71784 RepID=A0A1Y2AY41_9TREE|nr:carboxyl transferase domain-domain-containing protein [Naematelia encephala]